MATTVSRLTKVTIGGAAHVVDLLGGGFTVTPPDPGGGGGGGGSGTGDPARYMAASSGIAPPIQSHVATSAQQFMAGWHPFAAQWGATGYAVAFSNFWTDNSGSTLKDGGGVALAVQPEIDTPNSIKVSFGVSFDQGTTVSPIATDVVLAPGESKIWAFDVATKTPGQVGRIYWMRQVATGETSPGGYRSSVYTPTLDGQTKLPGARCTATEAEARAILAGGAYTRNESGSAAYYYGPSMVLAKGWDGRGCVFVPGDSIAQLPNWRSWVTRGLQDTTGGQLALGVINMSVNGTRWSGQSSLAPGHYRRKAEVLALGTALNTGGKLPFTHILSEHVVNDSGASYATWKAYTQAGLAFCKETWPGCPVTQIVGTPNTDSTPPTYADYSSQSASPNDTARWNLYADLMGSAFDGYRDHYIDNTAAWCDPTHPRVWKVTRNYTTLTANYAGSGAFVTNAQLPLGCIPVPEGQPTKVNGRVLTSSGSAGSYSNTLDSSASLPGSWPSGTVIHLAATRDGTHPEEPFVSDAAENVRLAKVAGFFGASTVGALS